MQGRGRTRRGRGGWRRWPRRRRRASAAAAAAAGHPHVPPGGPPGMQTPPGKMGPPGAGPGRYGAHPQTPAGLEDDFQHLGMIADLLDDSPGGGFF